MKTPIQLYSNPKSTQSQKTFWDNFGLRIAIKLKYQIFNKQIIFDRNVNSRHVQVLCTVLLFFYRLLEEFVVSKVFRRQSDSIGGVANNQLKCCHRSLKGKYLKVLNHPFSRHRSLFLRASFLSADILQFSCKMQKLSKNDFFSKNRV